MRLVPHRAAASFAKGWCSFAWASVAETMADKQGA
jgi:hypothetical protein